MPYQNMALYMASPVGAVASNAGPELLLEAGARHERTLEAVSSRPRLCQNSIFRKCDLTKSMV
jgi:hypothetical protein